MRSTTGLAPRCHERSPDLTDSTTSQKQRVQVYGVISSLAVLRPRAENRSISRVASRQGSHSLLASFARSLCSGEWRRPSRTQMSFHSACFWLILTSDFEPPLDFLIGDLVFWTVWFLLVRSRAGSPWCKAAQVFRDCEDIVATETLPHGGLIRKCLSKWQGFVLCRLVWN